MTGGKWFGTIANWLEPIVKWFGTIANWFEPIVKWFGAIANWFEPIVKWTVIGVNVWCKLLTN
jgi:hypothetical protein